jgi:hypothetical protein
LRAIEPERLPKSELIIAYKTVRYKLLLSSQQVGGAFSAKSDQVGLAYQADHHGRRRIPSEGDPRRYVFIQRARCPQCGQPRIRKYRTNRTETDGSRTSYAMCVHGGCGWTGFLIEE